MRMCAIVPNTTYRRTFREHPSLVSFSCEWINSSQRFPRNYSIFIGHNPIACLSLSVAVRRESKTTESDQIRLDQISRSVVSDSLQPHESQHARPPCPSPTPRVHSDSCPSSQWCHPAISSSVVPLSFCPNPSQHQSLFQWVNSFFFLSKVFLFISLFINYMKRHFINILSNSSHEVAKVLEFQL